MNKTGFGYGLWLVLRNYSLLVWASVWAVGTIRVLEGVSEEAGFLGRILFIYGFRKSRHCVVEALYRSRDDLPPNCLTEFGYNVYLIMHHFTSF